MYDILHISWSVVLQCSSNMTSTETTANLTEYTYVKPAIIGVMTTLNLLSNSLVICVLLRYPQLREDRNALFILSMSFSDMGSGLFDMLPSAVLCSSASPFVLQTFHYLPTVIGVAMWWFSFVSMYSLCWLIMSKNVAIQMPFRSDQLLSRKRCHVINALTWIVGFCVSAVLFGENLTWGDGGCSYNYPVDSTLKLLYTLISFFTLFLPRILLTWGTVSVIIVVMRTHRQIAAQALSVADDDGVSSTSGTVTAKTLRSSVNVLVICVVSIVLTTPVLIYVIHLTCNDYRLPSSYGFVCIWVFQLNTVANSTLYLIVFRSVRMKTMVMIRDMFICIRGY